MPVDLNDPEVKDAIKQAVEAELEAKVEAATRALVAKNRELLREKKEASGINPEEHYKVESERDEWMNKFNTADKALKQLTKDFEKVTNDHKSEAAFTQKLLVDNGLTEALVGVGVKEPAHLKAVKAMLASQVQIVADGDNRVAKVGDKPLAEFAKEWAASDEGKHFVSAPVNSGGGAQGGGGGGGVKTMKRSQFEALDAAGKAQFSKDKGVLTDD